MRVASEMWKMENLCLVNETFKIGLGKFIHSQEYKATPYHIKLPWDISEQHQYSWQSWHETTLVLICAYKKPQCIF